MAVVKSSKQKIYKINDTKEKARKMLKTIK